MAGRWDEVEMQEVYRLAKYRVAGRVTFGIWGDGQECLEGSGIVLGTGRWGRE